MQHTQRKAGFSLIELAVIIALIASCAALSIALIPAFTANSVRTELDILYQTCLYLKHHALLTGADQTLTFDLANNSYSYGKRIYKLPASTRFGVIAGAKGSPGNPQRTLETPCTFKHDRIKFYKDGAIDAGSIYLVDRNQKRMVALTIAVSEYAYMRRYRYNDGWQLV
jgi:type II secretory pathway pseudopilin PulG